MKRICHIFWASALLCICLALLTLSAAARAEFEMEIPYGTPTVDGVIDEGEYEVSYVMDQTTATAWVGEVGDSAVTWHLAWDEGGLYYAGTINDSTPSWRGNVPVTVHRKTWEPGQDPDWMWQQKFWGMWMKLHFVI